MTLTAEQEREQQNSGTKEVADAHRFDEAKLATWLEANVEGYQGPLEVRQFKGGQSNPTYQLVTPNQRYVLRRKPPGILLPSAHAVDREFKVLSGLYPTGFPVARPYALCEDDTVIGTMFYVMDNVEGRILWDQSLPAYTPAERTPLYMAQVDTLAALHNTDYVAAGLGDYGKPGNYFARQISRWTKQYQASVTDPIPAMDQLIAWLPENIPASARDENEVAIVHGDFRIDNLVFHPTEPRVIAVLDWELSTLGHPLADFSYHCMVWHIQSSGAARGIGGMDLAALGIPDQLSYVLSYCERTGRTDVDAVMQDWNFYLAYNLFRIAAILQGIAKRVVDGTASSTQAREAGAGARPLAELGWHFAS